MTQLFALIFFLVISSLAYFFNSLMLWELFALLLVLLIIFVPKLRAMVLRLALMLKILSLTLVLTFLMNLLMGSLEDAEVYTLRLAVMGVASLLFCFFYGLSNLNIAFKKLFIPLKFFNKRSYKNLSLILDISFAMIPLCIKSFSQLTMSLKSKGHSFSVKSWLKNPSLFISCWTSNFFNLVDNLTLSLKSKSVL